MRAIRKLEVDVPALANTDTKMKFQREVHFVFKRGLVLGSILLNLNVHPFAFPSTAE